MIFSHNPTRTTSLAQRFMIAIIPISLAGIVILGISAYHISRHHILRNVHKEVITLSQGTALSISNFFTTGRNDLEVLADTPLIANYYTNVNYSLREEAEQY